MYHYFRSMIVEMSVKYRLRAKTCFTCEQYIHIYSNNPEAAVIEDNFNKTHSGHMVQIVNLDEVHGGNYICMYKSENEMEKLANGVEHILLNIF